MKLENYCTVYQAEMYALYRATQLVLDSDEMEASILSDSRSALEAIKNPKTFHPLAFKIRQALEKLNDRDRPVRLFWIRAHKGAEGNERINELAKQAALRTKTKALYDACPISHIKRALRQDTLEEWQKRYTDGETAGTTKLFLPNVRDAYKIMRETKTDYKMTQLSIGHGSTSQTTFTNSNTEKAHHASVIQLLGKQ